MIQQRAESQPTYRDAAKCDGEGHNSQAMEADKDCTAVELAARRTQSIAEIEAEVNDIRGGVVTAGQFGAMPHLKFKIFT